MLCDYFNERWLTFTGRTLAQEVGNGWTEGVHADDFDRCLEIYTSHFSRREIFEMEYRLRRHDEEYRWIFDRGVPFFHGDGVFYWQSVTQYLHDAGLGKATHGICKTCAIEFEKSVGA